jgi:hypothetical protein
VPERVPRRRQPDVNDAPTAYRGRRPTSSGWWRASSRRAVASARCFVSRALWAVAVGSVSVRRAVSAYSAKAPSCLRHVRPSGPQP